MEYTHTTQPCAAALKNERWAFDNMQAKPKNPAGLWCGVQ